MYVLEFKASPWKKKKEIICMLKLHIFFLMRSFTAFLDGGPFVSNFSTKSEVESYQWQQHD